MVGVMHEMDDNEKIRRAIEHYYDSPHSPFNLGLMRSKSTILDRFDEDINRVQIRALQSILNRIFVPSADRISLSEIYRSLHSFQDIEPDVVTCISYACPPDHRNLRESVVCPETGCTNEICCVEEGVPNDFEPSPEPEPCSMHDNNMVQCRLQGNCHYNETTHECEEVQ